MKKFTIIIILIIIGFIAVIGYLSAHKTTFDVEVTATADEILTIDADDHVLGNPESGVVLYEYFDFECPACAAYHPFIQEALAQYGEKFAFVPRNYPLFFHLNGRNAALAVEAAAEQGKYHEMADLVLTTQTEWSGKAADINLFEVYATEVGLDIEQWRDDIASDFIALRVDTDLAEGNALEVPGTPTFFLNEEKLDNPRSPEELELLIDAAALKVSLKAQGQETHIHADLKIFTNNTEYDLSREQFQSDEEVEHDPDTHLHDGNGEMIHIHRTGVTLGRFIESIGIGLDDTCLITAEGVKYCNDAINQVTVMVNGNVVENYTTYEIQDLDQILISYGDGSNLSSQMTLVGDEACIYSESCPERGAPPTENCVGGIGTSCI